MTRPDGQPLSRILRGQPLPPGTVVHWALELARTLAAVHDRGGLYRDLKPSNIVVDTTGNVQLLDSGLDAMADLGLGHEGAPVLFGAPQYMSPEQVRGEPLDPRSDVFSYGVLLYEMTTGKRPFSGANSEAVLADILRAQPIPAHVLAPGAPPALERVIQRALAPNRADRHQNMNEVIRDLEGVAEELERGASSQRGRRVTDRPAAPPPRRWLRIAAFAAVTLGVAALVAIVPWSAPTADPRTILIVPFEVRGQSEGAEYLGRSFAEALAVNLAQAKDLHVLPVPQAAELTGVGALDRAAAARRIGAGRLLQGSIAHQGGRIETSVSLLDAAENRILWGTRADAPEDDLSPMAARLARKAASALGATYPRLYDYVGNLTGGPLMAASPLTTAVIGALRQGEIRPLLESTAKLVAELPGEPDALALRSHALMLAMDADPSLANRRALELSLDALDAVDPKNPYATFYRAYLAARDNRADEALRRTSALLARDDLTPAVQAWVLRHRAYIEAGAQGDPDGALRDLERALTLDPASARTFHILAETLLGLGRTEEALVRARQAVALMPSYWRHHQTLGLALSALGRPGAREAFATACAVGETQSACALHAIALVRAGEPDKARAEAERAAKLTEDPTGVYNLACYHALAGDSRRALELLRRAYELGATDTHPAEDADLASLRDHPEFRALLEKWPGRRGADGR